MEDMVLYNAVTKVGLVYFKLVKYMIRLKLNLKFLNDKTISLYGNIECIETYA